MRLTTARTFPFVVVPKMMPLAVFEIVVSHLIPDRFRVLPLTDIEARRREVFLMVLYPQEILPRVRLVL